MILYSLFIVIYLNSHYLTIIMPLVYLQNVYPCTFIVAFAASGDMLVVVVVVVMVMAMVLWWFVV